MRFENCLFDLYGTLVDIRTEEEDPALWAAMGDFYRAGGADYAPEALRGAYLRLVRGLERESQADYPEIRLELVFQRLYWEKGVSAGLDQAVAAGRRFRQISTRHLRLYPGAKELLGALREAGCGVYLLSNAQRIFTAGELTALGIAGAFDGIYLSSDYGCKKPDRRFFQALLQERQVDPRRAVMIGNDGACDVRGAQGVGLHTVYLRSNISPPEPLPPADYVFPRLDLPQLQKLLTE